MTEKKPQFVLNTVLPDMNLGPILAPEHQTASTAGWIREFIKGDTAFVSQLPPREFSCQLEVASGPAYITSTFVDWFVNVVDDAILHVAALLDADTQNQRILAYTEAFTFNGILDAAEKKRSDLKAKIPARFAEDSPQNQKDPSSIEGHKVDTELLNKYKGSTWTDFETTIQQTLENIEVKAK